MKTYTGQILDYYGRKVSSLEELAGILENDGNGNWEARFTTSRGYKVLVQPILQGAAFEVAIWEQAYFQGDIIGRTVRQTAGLTGEQMAQAVFDVIGSQLFNAIFYRFMGWRF